jgi:hypothetical protein
MAQCEACGTYFHDFYSSTECEACQLADLQERHQALFTEYSKLLDILYPLNTLVEQVDRGEVRVAAYNGAPSLMWDLVAKKVRARCRKS